MNKFEHVSPSQITTFEACPRKWYYNKIMGEPGKPESAAIQVGKDGHKRIEDWINGVKDERTPLILANEHLLTPYEARFPKNKGDMVVEKPIESLDLRLAGIPIKGFIDVHVPPPNAINIDHKFKGSLQYAKKEDELRKDPQAIIYSAVSMALYPEIKEVGFEHHNYITKGKKTSLKTLIVLTREQVEQGMKDLSETVQKMKNLATNCQDPDQAPTNRESCMAYGGCDYLTICKVHSQTYEQNLKMEHDMEKTDQEEIVNEIFTPAEQEKYTNKPAIEMNGAMYIVEPSLPKLELDLVFSPRDGNIKYKSSLEAYAALRETVKTLPKFMLDKVSKQMVDLRDSLQRDSSVDTGIVLYKNVAVHGDEKGFDFNTFAMKEREALSKEMGLVDVAMCPPGHKRKEELCYGNWKITLLERIKTKLPKGGIIVVKTMGGSVDFAMDYLMSISKTVVEGNLS